MAERQGNFPERPQPKSYDREYVRLPADNDSAQVILRGIISEVPRRG